MLSGSPYIQKILTPLWSFNEECSWILKDKKQPTSNNSWTMQEPHAQQGSNDMKTHPHGMWHLIRETAYRSYNHTAKPLRRHELLAVSKYRTSQHSPQIKCSSSSMRLLTNNHKMIIKAMWTLKHESKSM